MTQAPVGVLAPQIKFGGVPLSTAELGDLRGMHLEQALRLPSRLRVELVDPDFVHAQSAKFAVGSAAAVTLSDDSALFTGEVTGVELAMEHGRPRLVITADDRAYQMTLGNKVRTFLSSSYSDIVTKICGEYGLVAQVTATSGVLDYVLQSDTDFGFLTEIADRVGYDWWIDGKGELQFHPAGKNFDEATAELSWLSGLTHFSVRASALHPTKVTVNGWDSASASEIVVTSGSVEGTPNSAFVQPYLRPSKLAGKSTVTTGYHGFSDRDSGQGIASSAAAAATYGAVTAEGECHANGNVRVGYSVQIGDVGPASGKYSVTEVEHSYDAHGFHTRFVAGERRPTALVDTLASATVSSFRQDSLVVGVVTNLGDSQSPPGHIKVRFPTMGSSIESSWARVVSVGAGNGRGMTFIPEVNDEVIVGFEGGDVSRPLVLGSVYNGKAAPNDFGVNSGTVGKRQIVSRLGHVIELADGKGSNEQAISMTLAGGEHAISLSKEKLNAVVPAGLPVSIAAGQTKIEFDKQGNITIAGNKVTIKATQGLEMSGLEVKVKASTSLEGSAASVKMTGSGMAELSSGGMTAVKGATVAIN